jgi:hypothetical protein
MSAATGRFIVPHREVRHKQIAAGEARASVFRQFYDAPIEADTANRAIVHPRDYPTIAVTVFEGFSCP